MLIEYRCRQFGCLASLTEKIRIFRKPRFDFLQRSQEIRIRPGVKSGGSPSPNPTRDPCRIESAPIENSYSGVQKKWPDLVSAEVAS